MITRIKELLQIKELVDQLTENIQELENANSKSCDEAEALRKELKTLFKENRTMLSQAQRDMKDMKNFRQELKHELYEFKLFKKEVRKQLIDTVEKDLSGAKVSMQNEVTGFNEAKKKLDTKLNSVGRMESELTKLQEITKNLNAADFDLVRHKKNLDRGEKEKRELLRKIDHLERLVARQRRSRNP